MHRRNFARLSGVIVDECFHGTFLDAGELRRIKTFLGAGGEPLGARLRDTERQREKIERNGTSDDSDEMEIAVLAASLVGELL